MKSKSPNFVTSNIDRILSFSFTDVLSSKFAIK